MGVSWPSTRAAEIQAASAGERARLLQETATGVRAAVLRTIGKAGLGHVGGDPSVTDILITLLFGVMRVVPADPPRRWRAHVTH
jgi:transketolase